MIDLLKAQNEFKRYTNNYDITNKKIELKVIHTYKTMDIARQIAESLELDNENIELAELIGLLHDIGRFEQLRIYNTFSDLNSIDHAEFGIKILFEDGLIRNFIEDREFDDIIYKAIKNHNKYAIEDGLNQMELIHAKIIRDADKTDIYRVNAIDIENDINVLYDKDMIKKEIATPEIMEEFLQYKQADRRKMKNNIDGLIGTMSYIYDYNYVKGLEIVKDNKYIERILTILEGCKETEEQTKLIKTTILNYIDRKIEETKN